MNTEAALEHAVARIKEGFPSDHVNAELVTMGASQAMARDVVDRVLALQRDAQARDVAVSLFKEGHSAAQVWEALVSSGVEQATAESLVRELDQLRLQVEASQVQLANAPAPFVTQYGSDGWNPVETGSYGKGFVLGLLGGCVALAFSLLFSDRIGTETKRGLHAGFAIGLAIGIVGRVIRAMAESR